MEFTRRTVLGTIGAAGAGLAVEARGQQIPRPPDPSVPVHAAEPAQAPGVRGRMTGAKAAALAFSAERVPCVFGVPGAQNNEFWDAMKSIGLPYMLTSHESAAPVMADASARVSGRVGAFALIPGPGLTNAMTGIGEALLDTIPLVALVTDVKRGPKAPLGQVHSLNNAAILRTVTKAVFEVHHPGQIAAAIHRAFQVARAGPPGPVGVVVPYDLLSQTWDYDEPVPPELAPPWDEAAYRRALDVLRDPNRKVGIYAGLGAAEAAAELMAVAELLQAPVATTVSGKGVIPDDHPLAVGWGYGSFGTKAAERAFGQVDAVIAVGARYSEVSTANYNVPKHDHLIHVDIDPNVLGRNVPASVKVHADSRLFLARLLADGEQVRRRPDPRLIQAVYQDREAERAQHQEVQIKDGVDPMRFLALLGESLGQDGLMFVDVTASTHWAAESIRRNAPRRYVTPADNQSMGWAVSAAIGAQRTRPDLPVACVTGDGCFLMSGLEASTAARAHLPVKLFVLDDGAYHYMQMLQEPLFNRTTATVLANLDYPALARGMGLASLSIETNDQVLGGIAAALAHPGPILVRVAISYEGRDIRWLQSLRSSYLDKASTGQKARMAFRLLGRAANPALESD
ncbi:thiamine pyrophosphate-binding protein [Tautonia plasticadhaerens]|uniref:Acetolactate synthase isozyme 2 large subunit n=1 Tax=Tautonia plasticadhaerens TaxID=2527974 RepID=A0A518H1T6_9BACT|nr:thiamine pyrophosphate-binding protein [Tautonia plasticadhaerens]QDV34790.1 Acetolactate synthase isozyme 2 large subunit [Tautonia plasticadhaerens]